MALALAKNINNLLNFNAIFRLNELLLLIYKCY